MTTTPESPPPVVNGLGGVVAAPLERVLIRTRGSSATRSAWRLAFSSEQGPGAIVLVELTSEESHYRGEGACLGWSQSALAEAYRVLTAAATASAEDFVLPQLG